VFLLGVLFINNYIYLYRRFYPFSGIKSKRWRLSVFALLSAKEMLYWKRKTSQVSEKRGLNTYPLTKGNINSNYWNDNTFKQSGHVAIVKAYPNCLLCSAYMGNDYRDFIKMSQSFSFIKQFWSRSVPVNKLACLVIAFDDHWPAWPCTCERRMPLGEYCYKFTATGPKH